MEGTYGESGRLCLRQATELLIELPLILGELANVNGFLFRWERVLLSRRGLK